MTSDPLAEQIVEDLLFATGRALREDHKDVGKLFQVPQIMETVNGKRIVNSEDDVRDVFAGVRKYFAANKVTDVVRTVISAEFLTPELVGSSHVSQLMREGGEPFRTPYPVYTVTRWFEGAWRISASVIAIVDCADHVSALTDPIRPISDHGLLQTLTRNGGSEGRPRL